MSIKTYTVDFTQNVPSDLASSIIGEITLANNELDIVKNNTTKVQNETLKILRDIVDEINPHLKALDLKINFNPHFWFRDGEMKCSVILTDPYRAYKGRGIKIQIINPSQEVVINKVTTNKADFDPKVVVIEDMKEFERGRQYYFTTVKSFLEAERVNIKDMYLNKQRDIKSLVDNK